MFTRKLVLAVVGLTAALAQPSHAGLTNCTLANVQPHYISPTGYASCVIATTGNCTYYYDPLFDPFPSLVLPETIDYAFCLTL